MTAYQIIILMFAIIFTWKFINKEDWIISAVICWIWFLNIYPTEIKEFNNTEQEVPKSISLPTYQDKEIEWESN